MSYIIRCKSTDGSLEQFEYIQDEDHVESLTSVLLARETTTEITITKEVE